MTTYLLYGSSLADPDVRHEIAEPVGDPVVFIEHDGKRIVVCSSFEESLLSKREDLFDEVWTYDHLGAEELLRTEDLPSHLLGPELALRAVKRVGAMSVVVPPSFPLSVADHLRTAHVEVVPDAETAWDRRRGKSPWELEGIERAQRAADTAMITASRMLRSAERTADGRLRFEGEILTAELIRDAMNADLVAQGAEAGMILVQSGDVWRTGHDEGRGPVAPDQTCIVDCVPRDRRTGVYTDMTRTFVPGTASHEVNELHASCLEALEIAFRAVKPGAASAFAEVSEYFHSRGFPTQIHHDGNDPLSEGFMHALGHGVGLEVHEKPSLGRRSDELRVGDVVAVEPGLYFKGVGGVRLEDTVLLTDEGFQHFTDPYPYDLEP